MTNLRDRDEFKRGQAGELFVAAWLKRRECYVIPSYDYCGSNGDKAPRLQGLWAGHPVPDLDVCRDGYRFWVEVKTKEKPVKWEKTGELRHGIDLRLLEHYRTVQLISGSPCYLFIYEENSRYLLAETFAKLGNPVSVGTIAGKKVAFWARDSFRELDRIEGGLCHGSGSKTHFTRTPKSWLRAMRQSACTSAAARTPPSISLTGSSPSPPRCSMVPATPVHAGTPAPARPRRSRRRSSEQSSGAVREVAGACRITSSTTHRSRPSSRTGGWPLSGSSGGAMPKRDLAETRPGHKKRSVRNLDSPLWKTLVLT